MANIKLTCPVCKQEFERRRAEYNRSQKLGRVSYCSRDCSKQITNTFLKKGGNEQHLLKGGEHKRDEFTRFKWFMRCVRRRKKEHNIDLAYLKQIWEEQKGVCPLTGWELELPHHSSDWKTKDNKIQRASLDRIDSNKGYVKGNVRFISVMANYCKNQFTDEDVILFCEAVIKKTLTNS